MGVVHVAAVLGLEAAITLLDLHGADLNFTDSRGATALLLATAQARTQVRRQRGVPCKTWTMFREDLPVFKMHPPTRCTPLSA